VSAARRVTGWLLSPRTLPSLDDAVDADGIYAKGYWQTVDDRLQVVGLRIGSDYNDRVVALFGQTVIRRPDGTYYTLPTQPTQEN
jgi:hypothetical protein